MENMDGFSYTKYAKAAIAEGFKDELNSFYCREDFVDVLGRLDNAEPDNIIFWNHEFVQMCNARGLNPISLKEDRCMLGQVPTREELLDDLVKMFYKNYEHWYSSEDFMTRIVRRLAPEYAKDTVRVAILKKFILGAGFQWEQREEYPTQKVLHWAMDQFSIEEREEYDKKDDLQDRLEMIVEKLNDNIFSEENLKQQGLTDEESFLLIVKVLNNWAGGNKRAKRKEITTDKKAVKSLKDGQLTIDEIPLEFMEDMPMLMETRDAIRDFCIENELEYDDSIKNIDNLKEIADATGSDRLSVSDKNTLLEKVFPLVKTDFRNFGLNTYSKTQKGNLKQLWDVYKDDYLKGAESGEKKKSQDQESSTSGDWEILRLCDNYAKGIFRNYGDSQKTRILLYYFAIMFGMTVKKSETDVPDPETDVDKNLFRDYYNDNVLRYLEREETTKEAQNRESEPLGEGINYKSYAETIYLYFLCHRELGLNPGDCIDQAKKLIDACVKTKEEEGAQKNPGEKNKEISRADFTVFYQEAYFYEALKKEKRDLINYILKYYKIETHVPPLKTASEQVGAFENIKWAQEAPYFGNREPDNHAILTGPKENRNSEQYKWLHEIPKFPSKITKDEWLWVIPNLLNEREKYLEYKSDDKFMQIVRNLNEHLRLSWGSIGDKKISRNKYLSAFLYTYIQNLKTKGIEDKERKFPEVYDDFCNAANQWLEDGRFQHFNCTNLVDLYVFLTYYAFLVRNIEVRDLEYDLECNFEKMVEYIKNGREKQTELQEEKEGLLQEEPEF